MLVHETEVWCGEMWGMFAWGGRRRRRGKESSAKRVPVLVLVPGECVELGRFVEEEEVSFSSSQAWCRGGSALSLLLLLVGIRGDKGQGTWWINHATTTDSPSRGGREPCHVTWHGARLCCSCSLYRKIEVSVISTTNGHVGFSTL